MKESVTLRVNGRVRSVEVDPSAPLMYVLRNELRLSGPKYGCGLEQCGSCMVLLDGEARPSCRLPVAAASGAEIVTLEGLMREGGDLHPLQQAFVAEQAAQCGYCLNGMIMAGLALLNRNPNPDRAAINDGMGRNLCRCGAHARIVRAIQSAAETMKTSTASPHA